MKRITKEEFQDLSLLIDILWPTLVEKYLTMDNNPIKIHIKDEEIRKKIKYDASCVFILIRTEFNLIYPVKYIKLALNTRKRYKRIKIKK